MDLAEERSLLSDADECMAARDCTDPVPSKRISAEVTLGCRVVNPEHTDSVLKQLDPPHLESIAAYIELTPIACALTS